MPTQIPTFDEPKPACGICRRLECVGDAAHVWNWRDSFKRGRCKCGGCEACDRRAEAVKQPAEDVLARLLESSTEPCGCSDAETCPHPVVPGVGPCRFTSGADAAIPEMVHALALLRGEVQP